MSDIVQQYSDKARTQEQYPITLEKCVYDDNGNRLDNTIQGINDSLNSKASKSGDVFTGNLFIKDTGIEIGDTPTITENRGIVFSDKNGINIGHLYHSQNRNGAVSSYIDCKKKDGSNSVSIEVGYDANGNSYTRAPKPAASSNTNEIATTNWVNDFLASKFAFTSSQISRVRFGNASNSNETYSEIFLERPNVDTLGNYGYCLRFNITSKQVQIYSLNENHAHKALVGKISIT